MRSDQIFERIHYREWSNEQESLVMVSHVYFARVKQRTAEIVANAIIYHLVRNISEECRTYLQSELLKEKDIAALMIEYQKITEERNSIQDNLTRLRKGLEAIDKIETSFG